MIFHIALLIANLCPIILCCPENIIYSFIHFFDETECKKVLQVYDAMSFRGHLMQLLLFRYFFFVLAL